MVLGFFGGAFQDMSKGVGLRSSGFIKGLGFVRVWGIQA